MGDEPDRKTFLDRLLYFLEEKGTPITSMPQISKQPLDLYKLYHSVKDRGGMVEVSCSLLTLFCDECYYMELIQAVYVLAES